MADEWGQPARGSFNGPELSGLFGTVRGYISQGNQTVDEGRGAVAAAAAVSGHGEWVPQYNALANQYHAAANQALAAMDAAEAQRRQAMALSSNIQTSPLLGSPPLPNGTGLPEDPDRYVLGNLTQADLARLGKDPWGGSLGAAAGTWGQPPAGSTANAGPEASPGQSGSREPNPYMDNLSYNGPYGVHVSQGTAPGAPPVRFPREEGVSTDIALCFELGAAGVGGQACLGTDGMSISGQGGVGLTQALTLSRDWEGEITRCLSISAGGGAGPFGSVAYGVCKDEAGRLSQQVTGAGGVGFGVKGMAAAVTIGVTRTVPVLRDPWSPWGGEPIIRERYPSEEPAMRASYPEQTRSGPSVWGSSGR